MDKEIELLQRGIDELGLSASPERLTALIQYLEILDTTNQFFNLTRIPRGDFVTMHILDSLTALPAISTETTQSILDIGTGAGFPGVPLAALLPNCAVTLLDSTAKKVHFAHETAHACGITNCIGLHARAENLAKERSHRERYDIVVSRAVASFDALIGLMLPLVKRGGVAIALKGPKTPEELHGTESIVKSLGGLPAEVKTVKIPTTEIERYLVIVRKRP